MFIVSIVIGVLIVLSAIFLLRREFLNAVQKQGVFMEQAKIYGNENLNALLLDLQKSIDDMNRAFYEIANDLEGKYSVHEKMISDLEKQWQNVALQFEALSDNTYTASDSKKHTRETIKIYEPTTPQVEFEENNFTTPVEEKTPDFEDDINERLSADENAVFESLVADDDMNQILKLAEQGLDKRQIAREMGMGLGALDLMLKMKNIHI